MRAPMRRPFVFLGALVLAESCMPWVRNREPAPEKRRGVAALLRHKCNLRPLSPATCRLLYCATIVNPVISVCANEYRSIVPLLGTRSSDSRNLAAVYRTLFYFARLKPRLLFVVGSALRALQQTTPLKSVFDPAVGVGAGLNVMALATASRWPSALLLGWASSKPFWQLLRAAPPAKVQVPIRISF